MRLPKELEAAVSRFTHPQIDALGDSGVVVRFGEQIDPAIFVRVRAFSEHLERNRFPGLIEHVPAFASVALHYDPAQASFADVSSWVEASLANLGRAPPSEPRKIEVPVCYGGEFGSDLEFVARHAGLTTKAVVKIHAEAEYLVYMLGFAPGFPYLGGMSARIAAPRRATPRVKVPAGSVGIAGSQTGIYPLATPGGWQLIGRTPLDLFRPAHNPPTLLRAGDVVKFRPIDADEFHSLRERSP
jgi:inhibitor of KinA